ncbi:fasciclin-like arabinogalactan protein 21 [Diospyros lotus]|uniref:fasciclin-like arabinogalactan protein 21 n=1 Tax=Diospyros lotus TaxID=55363 RepID=UPI0022508D71|nr:fasciclin-like arabinogalactan protein 21 [Diospyros lotus]
MATPLKLFIVAAFFLSINGNTVATKGAPTTPPPEFRDHDINPLHHFGPVLADLGFHGFSSASPALRNTSAWRGPVTVFAPADSSLLTCPTCSVPLLLHEHTVPGLFPIHYLRTLAYGTKIETLAEGKCITITFSNDSEEAVFVGGVKITSPDLYNDGFIAVHGLKGFIAHLSPYSCHVERMTSLSFPHLPAMAPFLLMRLMLKDAMLRLSISGYGVVSLALKLKSAELLELHAMTVFAVDDVAIFSGAGHEYLPNFRFHVVPNRLLMAADLEKLPAGTLLPTMALGQKLVMTTAGGNGFSFPPISVDHVRIKSPDLLYNLKIVVHGLSVPFPHTHHHSFASRDEGRQNGHHGWVAARSKATGRSNHHEMRAPTPAIEPMIEIDDRHGL